MHRWYIFCKRYVIPWYKRIRLIHPLSFPSEIIRCSSSGRFSYKYIQTLLSSSNVSKQTTKKVLRTSTFWNRIRRGCFPEHLNLNHFKSHISCYLSSIAYFPFATSSSCLHITYINLYPSALTGYWALYMVYFGKIEMSITF